MAQDHWRVYYDDDTVRRADALRQDHALRSGGVDLHVDVYPPPRPEAPVVVFNHGAAGYCRLFVGLALRFHECGFGVVLPDQRGQGLSGGPRGDYTVAECVDDVLEAARWARTRFAGPLFMAGGSMGGALTYYAAVAGAPVHAIACLDLFDFGNGRDGLALSRFAGLARHDRLATLVTWLAGRSRPVHGLRIPFGWVGVFEELMDERDAHFQAQWDADPIPPRRVTLRCLASNASTPPEVPFERNTVPVLVINQGRDRMVDPAVTRRNYERLAGPKRYLEIDFGHWSSQPAFWNTIVDACVDWFGEHVPSR